MKVTYMPDKVSDEVSDEKFITRLISCIEGDEHTPSLDTPAMAEFVEQRRRDALRIMKLTLRATEALAAVEQDTENVCLLPVRSQPDSADTRKSFNLKKTLKGARDA